MEFFEKIKQHPYLAAIIVFVIGGALVIFLRSNGSQSAPTSSNSGVDTETAAATQLQMSNNALAAGQAQEQAQAAAQQESDATNLTVAQLAQQVQLNGQNVQADVINKQTAAGVTVAGFQADTQDLDITKTAETQQQQNALTAQTAQLSTTLNAEVAMNASNNQLSSTQIAAGVQEYTTNEAASVQEYTVNQGTIQHSQDDALFSQQLSNIAQGNQLAYQASTQSWWDSIF